MIRTTLFWLRRTVASARLLRSVEHTLRSSSLEQTISAGPQLSATTTVADPDAHARHQAKLVRRLARMIPGNTSCLRQAITTQRLLRADGVASTVRIGIERLSPGSYRMHAWLMHDDRPVLETPSSLAGYRITHELP